MTRNLEWTERHWKPVRTLLADNGPMPWDAVLDRLYISSSGTITAPIGDVVIRTKMAEQEVEAVRRGNTRRKRGAMYLRLVNRTPKLMDADSLTILKHRSARRSTPRKP